MLQLNPALSVQTKWGWAWAHFAVLDSRENEMLFVVFLNETGECILVPHQDIRGGRNYTVRRETPDSPGNPPQFMAPFPGRAPRPLTKRRKPESSAGKLPDRPASREKGRSAVTSEVMRRSAGRQSPKALAADRRR